MKYKNKLNSELIDTICNDEFYIIDFLDIFDELKAEIKNKIIQLDNNTFIHVWNKYHNYQSIKDTITDYKEEDRDGGGI